MRLIRAIDELRPFARGVFVPTMGALHEGHAALVRRARAIAGPGESVLVSIFVNPTQFAPGEDFARYPRTLDADIALAESAGADVVFAPDVETVYPTGRAEAPFAAPPLPSVATAPKLEDAHRPSHFAGVCQVVARLFDLVQPRVAVFGEKDFQQLRVIESLVAMVAAATPARWPVWRDGCTVPGVAGVSHPAIVGHPTVREPDGLAMSSRNRYLDAAQRERALGLSRALRSAAAAQRPAAAERAMRETLVAHGLSVDYAVVRDAATLMPVESLERPTRALIAARIDPSRPDSVRLIDNAAMPVRR
ncbi:MAG: pantoate--beta-alanine ligase [Phycisphaerales bacterium]